MAVLNSPTAQTCINISLGMKGYERYLHFRYHHSSLHVDIRHSHVHVATFGSSKWASDDRNTRVIGARSNPI